MSIIKNKKMLVVILTIVFVIAVPMCVNWLMSFGNTVTSNDWIGFFGSYFGALIGGLVAFGAAWIQINRMRKDSQIEEIKNFFKVYYVLDPIFKDLSILLNYGNRNRASLINLMHEHLNREHDMNIYEGEDIRKFTDNRGLAKLALLKIIEVNDELKLIQNTIESINDNYIPYEFYEAYIKTKNRLRQIIDFTETFLFHDELTEKTKEQKELNEYHDKHSNNDVIQARLVEDRMYGEITASFYNYHDYLTELFNQKSEEIKKLKKLF
ncbi:hypothetical protein MUN88_17160 [Gracilibacillus caseinilyticus]|uniref:5-bromo-4-chloroindolyl phosphate hydrolysis protein n=1 Tax=Gracilibacillus caseinilyticus TaxID=2932256 RepID=A0ABY4EVA2_9BACI|nr:hypothetical protein [Gracilibacillus caseinilyticus]UOQ47762.1 hypothetical protein MUN88_17160 [Gracilibacillus caseinilyticus]